MRLITKQSLIDELPERWKASYYRAESGWLIMGKDKEDVYNKLLSLPKPVTEEQTVEIIGNRCWTEITCSECKKDVLGGVIQFYEDEHLISLCRECLEKAIDLIAPKVECCSECGIEAGYGHKEGCSCGKDNS